MRRGKILFTALMVVALLLLLLPATVFAQLPLAPSNLVAVAISPGQVDLTWTDNSGNESSFRIERADDAAFTLGLVQFPAPANAVSFSDATTVGGATLFYRVFAVDSTGDSPSSNVVPVTMPPDTAVLAAPTGLLGVVTSGNQVELRWTDNSGNETGFIIERSSDGTVFTEVGIVGPNVATFTDATVAAGDTVFFRVSAVNSSGKSPLSSVVQVTVTSGPLAPGGLAAQPVGPTTVNLSWVDNSNDETGFRIERSPGGTVFTEIGTVGPNIAAFSDGNATVDGTFSYRVIALSDGEASAPSDVVVVTTSTVPASVLPVAPPAQSQAGVVITSPADGATIVTTEGGAATVDVIIQAGNFTTADPGANVTGDGRIVYYLDVAIPTTPGQTATSAPGTFQVSDTLSASWTGLGPGNHTLGVQLLSSDGTPMDPPVTAEVTITVAGPGPSPSPTTPGPSPTMPGQPPSPTAPSARAVTIISPAAGAVIEGGTLEMSVDVGNFTAVEPGANATGDGHIVYYLDVDIPTTPGQPAVTAPGTYQATAETLVGLAGLEPGNHTLGVQLVNNDGTPMDPPVTAEVTITVAEASAPSPAQSPVPTLTPETGEASSDTNWGLVGGAIALAIIVIGSGIFLLGRGRRGGAAA